MNYHWAQDAVQDAMLDAYRFLLEHPERDIHHPKGWLRKITRRAASRLMKRFYLKDGSRAANQGAVETLSDKPLEALSVCLAELDPVLDRDQMDHFEALVEKREREKELREVMDALLTKEEVFLINAKYVEGLKYEQLAEYMEKPVGTLKSAIKRAKAKVRAGLEQKWAFS